MYFDTDGTTLTGSLIASEISSSADLLRHRIYNLNSMNTIELNQQFISAVPSTMNLITLQNQLT